MAEILITGCSSGIGLATATRFAEAGDRVFATVLDRAEGTELERARTDRRLPITTVELDVTERRLHASYATS